MIFYATFGRRFEFALGYEIQVSKIMNIRFVFFWMAWQFHNISFQIKEL